MKNVTISMDDADLAWVRAQAGVAGVSVSRWIADRLHTHRDRQREALEADLEITALLAQLHAKPFVPEPRKQTYRQMMDEELDERFRRFDHPPVSAGSEREDEGGHLRNVAEPASTFDIADREPSDPE